MSRSYGSYDADWQRTKSVLIRSLFHEIPILSPVEEESNDSSQQYYVPTQEVFQSPPRPYSPLPPLIIEKVPIVNKHDEPEEYYNKLYYKIKRIYKKLFIEKRNFNSIDFGSNYSHSLVNEDSDGIDENLDFRFLESNSPSNVDSIIEDKEARQSSASTKSDGYGADFESMDTEIIDVVNYTASIENSKVISDKEESDNENIDRDGIKNEDFDCSKSIRKRIGDPEFRAGVESHHFIIDDHEMTEGEESNEPEDEQSFEKEGEHDLLEETSQTAEFDTVRIDDAVFSGGEEPYHSSIDDSEKSESEESNEMEDELQPNNVTNTKQDSFEQELKSKEFEKTASDNGNELMEPNVEPMGGDLETSDSSEGPAYRQITTAAMVHCDGSQDAEERESRVYEDSVKSVILPTRFRRVVVSRNVDVDDRNEVLTVLDDNADSKTTPSIYTDESDTTEEDFEKVTTPQLKAKEERIIETRTPQADTPEEDDQERSTSRLHAPGEEDKDMTTPQPECVDEHAKGMGSPKPTARGQEIEEMGIPLPEATHEDVEEMGTSRSDAPEEEDEEMTTPQPESAEEGAEGMGSPQPTVTDEETEEMEIPLPKATEGDAEEMGITHLESHEKDDEESTPQESGKKDIEESGSPQPTATDEDMEISLPKVTEEDVEEMSITQLESQEEDDEEMSTPQESGEEDVEGMGSPQPAARNEEIKATEEEVVKEMGSPHPIEQMRTPRPDLSHGTIPTTHRSHSESTSEHTAVPQELTALTSSTQDGADHNLSEIQTSNDMNEILTSIFNESRNKDGTPISGRKRKCVDKSVQAVQTNRVTWDEMRANFFVGTPKIFRLCACADHICY